MTPGKGGQDVEGVPVFNTFHDAVAETGANTAMIFVPPRFAADSILEAEDAGIALVIAITEGIPAHDELRVYNHLRGNPNCRLIGPNCPGILSPGKANVGIIPASFFKEGNVGVVSRSGTLTYQIGNELAQSGFGNSSIVGIGGDPVPGSSFIDIIELFEADPETELIVMAGEIGGSAEEEAADFIAEQRLQAGRRLHRRLHRAARQDDGPRRRDRLRHQGHRRREGRGARGEGRAGRPHPDRGRGDRGRDRRLARALSPRRHHRLGAVDGLVQRGRELHDQSDAISGVRWIRAARLRGASAWSRRCAGAQQPTRPSVLRPSFRGFRGVRCRVGLPVVPRHGPTLPSSISNAEAPFTGPCRLCCSSRCRRARPRGRAPSAR